MPNLDYIEIARALEQKRDIQVSVEEQETFAQIWEVSTEYTLDFDSGKSFKKLNAAIAQPQRKSRRYVWYAAASVFVVLGAAVLGILSNRDVVYSTLKGESKSIVLDDQSRIEMQGGSELIIHSDFNEKERALNLEGVAFFDVAKNPQKPFIINTKSGIIRVLGTSFTIHAEDETQRFAVDVYEGRVHVNKGKNAKILTKGMHLELNENGDMIVSSNSRVVPYSDMLFTFVDSRVADVVKEIENKFGIQVKYSSNLANQKVTIKTKAESADKLLRILSATLESEFSTVQEN